MTGIDLASLAQQVARRLGQPVGYMIGRTAIRDTIVDLLGCSEVKAERLVAQLEGRKFIQYPGSTIGGIDRPVEWTYPRA